MHTSCTMYIQYIVLHTDHQGSQKIIYISQDSLQSQTVYSPRQFCIICFSYRTKYKT